MQDTKSLAFFNLTPQEIERFHSKINKTDTGKCWLWKGKPMSAKRPYGRFCITRNGKPMSLLAHRVAFFLHWGIDPAGYSVCHECDVPLCCNPHCLFSGTHEDNMKDRGRKGRQADTKGEKNPKAKLNKDKVREMRRLYVLGICQKELSQQFDISVPQVSAIVNGKFWRNI